MKAFWTSTEQKLFSRGLERFGNNPTEDIWMAISEGIGTKTPRETYLFAFSYLLQLQSSCKHFLEETRLHNIEYSTWGKEENRIFEGFLSVFTDNEENRWEKISGALCARKYYRSPEEIERHYLKLVFDINNIVCNEKVFKTFEISKSKSNVNHNIKSKLRERQNERDSIGKLDLITPLKRSRSDDHNIQTQQKRINLNKALKQLEN